MVEKDTIRLLRECDAGVKMGISSIEDSVGYVKNEELKKAMTDSLSAHKRIEEKMQSLLLKYNDIGKEPAVMAKGMEWVKTNITLALNATDTAIADFITDGCNMGIKSLTKYLNQYKAADESSKNISKELIEEEESLRVKVKNYL